MSYYQKIKQLILDDDNETALHDWVMAQPLTEQLQITQTVKDVLTDMLEHVDIEERNMYLQQLDNFVENYNDKVLDEHNAAVKYNEAVKKRDEKMAEVEETIEGVRAYIIQCVTTNAPNAKEMKELALKIIESEKEHGLYDPENWKGII